MSGLGKKYGKTSRSHNLGDVTLADYANSSVSSGKGRLGKAKTSFNVVCEVKKLNIQDKAWDEKVDEFEGDFDFVKEENEDGEEVYVMKKATSRRKKTLSESIAESRSKGNTYPLDVWHLIAKFIRPEDVATFAAICKSSWCVVNTPSFWLNLYKRYYKDLPSLPARLRPECMVRHHGLKACVVRSLFYTYPPLAARIDRANISSPYNLRSRQCISVWQEVGLTPATDPSPCKRQSSKWKLCFKLRRKDCQPRKINKGDLEEILGDIFANTDDGCTILQVVSSEKTVPPAAMGLTLHSINLSLDMTMAHMAVQLVFGTGRIFNGKLDTTGTVALSLKTVLQVSVLDWWHPRYPHSSNCIIRADET